MMKLWLHRTQFAARVFSTSQTQLAQMNAAQLSQHLVDLHKSRTNDEELFEGLASEIEDRCKSMRQLPPFALIAKTFAQAHPLAPFTSPMLSALADVAFVEPSFAPQTRIDQVAFCHALACCNVLQLPSIQDYLQLTEPRLEQEFGQADLERNRPGFVLKGEAGQADLYPQFRVPVEENPLDLHQVLLAWRKTRRHPPPLLAMLASPEWFSLLCFDQQIPAAILPRPAVTDIVAALQALGQETATPNFQSPLGLVADIMVRPDLAMFCLSEQDFLKDGNTVVGNLQLTFRLLQAEGINTCIVKECEWNTKHTETERKLFLYPKLFPASLDNQDLYLYTVPPQLLPVDVKQRARPELTRDLPY